MYGDVQHIGRAHFINDLVYKVHEAKKEKSTNIVLFGDGKPLRQFMFGGDFAKIISLYITKDVNISMNVAPNNNMSIHDMALIALKVLDFEECEIIYDDSLPNGQHRKDVSANDVETIFPNFEFTTLESGISLIYEHLK